MPNSPEAEKTELKTSRPFSKSVIICAVAAFICVPAVIALGTAVWDSRKYYIVSLAIILLSMIPFALKFEKRSPKARELVVLAVMIAIGVAGRAAFYMLPQFKPVTAIVIICGIAFGSESGFIVGAMTGFLSNFIFGQGPYTPWQMEGWGIVGFLSGLLFFNKQGKEPQLPPLCIFGFIASAVIYGVIVDISTLFTTAQDITWASAKAVLASGVVFNLIHGAATVVFLLILAKPMLKKLERVRVKYGLFE